MQFLYHYLSYHCHVNAKIILLKIYNITFYFNLIYIHYVVEVL